MCAITGGLPKKLKSSIFDFSSMGLTAKEVPLPTLHEREPPPFIAPEGWMDNLCNAVLLNPKTSIQKIPVWCRWLSLDSAGAGKHEVYMNLLWNSGSGMRLSPLSP